MPAGRHATPHPDRDADRAARSARAGLAAGVVAISIGWVPFLCVLGAAAGAVAVVLGVRARRWAPTAGDGGAAVATGSVGLALAVVGVVASVVLVREVTRFEDPGEHVAELSSCRRDGGATVASGTIRNLEGSSRDYVVEVRFSEAGPASLPRTGSVRVDDVPAGGSSDFRVEQPLAYRELDCAVVEVTGPPPFGLEPGS